MHAALHCISRPSPSRTSEGAPAYAQAPPGSRFGAVLTEQKPYDFDYLNDESVAVHKPTQQYPK